MAFDESSITEVFPPVFYGQSMELRWTSTATAGTPFQVYVGGQLFWHGYSRNCSVPAPLSGQRTRIDIGTVAVGEETTDFSSTISSPVSCYAKLSWSGGSYLDPSGAGDVAGFKVYGESSPGSGVNYTKPLAKIPVYDGGINTSGYGQGGYGQGGYGSSGSTYSWTSAPLYMGTWNFAVTSFDLAGNESTHATTSVSVLVPPRPPAFYSDGTREHYVYNSSTHSLTLNWNASPDA